MAEIVYSQSRHPQMEGRLFENPRHFTGVRDDVSKVIVVGDFPHIVAAYKARKVEVVEQDKVTTAKATAALLARSATGVSLTDAERRKVYIPDDWADLPWTQKAGEDGLTLRALASALTDVPVINKTQAEKVVQAELDARPAPVEAGT